MTSLHIREAWLNNLAAMMAPRFEELGHPVPAFRVSIGFTGAPKKARARRVLPLQRVGGWPL